MKRILRALSLLLLCGSIYAAPPDLGPVEALIVNDETVPVPSKNVNEPGREPYNFYIEYSQFGCSFNCYDFNIFGNILLFNGPTVPLDKRLVVRWVSGIVPSDTQFNSISFQQRTIIANQFAQWQYYGPFHAANSSGTLWGMSSGAFFTVEPGEPLRVRVSAASLLNNFSASISVGGYLIDAE